MFDSLSKPSLTAQPSGSTQALVNDLGREFEGELAYLQATADGSVEITVRRDITPNELAVIVRNLDSVDSVEGKDTSLAL